MILIRCYYLDSNLTLMLVTFPSLAMTKAKDLEKVVIGNSDSNFFLDEVPVGVSGIQTKLLNDLALKHPAHNYLWIACQSHQPPSANYLKSKKNKIIFF